MSIAGRGLDKIDGAPGYKRLNNIGEITALAERYTSSRQNVPRRRRIEILIREAASQITDTQKYRRVRLIYGLDTQFEGQTASERREDVYKEFGESHLNKSVQTKNDREALKDLEHAIIAQVASKDTPNRPLREPGSIGAQLRHLIEYVKNSEYHDRFRTLVEEGNTLIAICGESGNGKSRLALELVRHAASKSLYLHGQRFSQDLSAVLSARGRPVISPDFEQMKIELAALLNGSNAPEYVIIDDLENIDLVENVLPSDSRSVIIVTSRHAMPRCRNSTILVEAMSDDDGFQLAKKVLGSKRKWEAWRVARALGGRPIAIVQISRAITRGLLESEAFISNLRHDPVDALDGILTDAYNAILTQLGLTKSGRVAREILLSVACVDNERIPTWVIFESLPSSISPTSIARALDQLQDLFLVRVDQAYLSVHSLTHQLLENLLSPYDGERHVSLCRVLLANLKDIDRNKPLSPDVLDVMPHAVRILIWIKPSPTVDCLAALVIVGMRQLGDWGVSGLFIEWELIAPTREKVENMPNTVLEWASYEHGQGGGSATECAAYLRMALSIKYHTEDYVKKINTTEWLKLAGALRDAGQFEELDKMMVASNASLDKKDPFVMFDYGNLCLFEAEIHYYFCRFSEADRAAAKAELSYNVAVSTEGLTSAGTNLCRTSKFRGLIALTRGDYSAAESHHNQLIEYFCKNFGLERDAHLSHSRARLDAERFHIHQLQLEDPSAPVHAEEAREIEELFVFAWNLYPELRDVNEIKLERLLFLVSLDPRTALSEIAKEALVSKRHIVEVTLVKYSRYATYLQRDGFYSWKLLLVGYIALYLSGEGSDLIASKCREIAFRFAHEYSSLRWYCEALSVAWLVAERNNWPQEAKNRILSPLISSAKSIDNLRRFGLIVKYRSDNSKLRHIFSMY